MEKQIRCRISTVAREGNYIYELLPLISSDQQVQLIVGTPDSRYLERYQGDLRFEIIAMSPSEWDSVKIKSIHYRAAYNYWRALTVTERTVATDGLLLFEDDVLPSVGWRHRFENTVNQIQSVYGDSYILSLYCPLNISKHHDGFDFIRYPRSTFYGTQTIYYPETVRPRFADYLKTHGLDSNRAPYDILLKNYAASECVPLLATIPPLVQHIGRISTGLGNFHQSNQFKIDPTV